MWSVMETYGDTVMMFDNKQGVDRVKKEREAYAFFMESSTIEYEVQRNCDLTEVGAWLDNKAYGIAMPFSECSSIGIRKLLTIITFSMIICNQLRKNRFFLYQISKKNFEKYPCYYKLIFFQTGTRI